MPSFPSPGTVTVCEINREWITADSLSDDRAKETYGKILGMVFSPLPFQLEHSASPSYPEQENELRQEETAPTVESTPAEGLLATVWGITTSYLKHLSSPNNVKLLSEVDLHGISWHQNKHILAFISGPNQVSVRDFEDSECNDPALLTHESQRDVKVLEWRPNGGRMLAVACRGGICIWAASYPGNTATVRSGAPSFIGALTRSSGLRWTLVDFFRSQNDEQISALSWSPTGRYLASASYESSSFTIWDVAQGVGTPIRRGLSGISMLKWSPTGDYFFAAKFDGTFYLWETNTWTSELWSSTSGIVTGAVWDPDGRMILVSFSKSATLGSIHFSAKPPSMDALLLPVELPEISSLPNGECIEKIAWSASGERLAVSFKGGDEAHQGLIAIYDVRRTSVISASLIGYIRGPGDCPKPVAFSFHDKFKQGPLLSVVDRQVLFSEIALGRRCPV